MQGYAHGSQDGHHMGLGPKYHYYLDLTNSVTIWAKPARLQPEKKTWLDIHQNKLVTKGAIGPILLGE